MVDKPRKAWAAGILSFITIGLGHVYSGEAKKGILFYFGQAIILAILLPLIVTNFNIYIILISILIGFIYLIFVLVDAVRISKKHSDSYSLKKYNKWYIYLILFVSANFVVQPTIEIVINKNIIQTYKIPSGAMIPTLLIGDRILVNKYAYRNSNPQRGDVAVFIPPHEPSKIYVKRIIGIGADRIEIKDKQLFVNGVAQSESYIIHSDSRTIPSNINPRNYFGPVTVPEDHFFFLGDNRDNSHDSRFWGFVEKDKILGKVMSFYWSWDKNEKKVRWERIGKNIEELTN